MHRILTVVVVVTLGLWLAGLNDASAQEPTPTPEASAPASDGGFWSDFQIGDLISLITAGVVVTGIAGLALWVVRTKDAQMELLREQTHTAQDEVKREKRHSQQLQELDRKEFGIQDRIKDLLERQVEDAKAEAGIDASGQLPPTGTELPQELQDNLSKILELLSEMKAARQEPAPAGARTDEQIAEEHLTLGNAYSAAGEYDKAFTEYDEALAILPEDAVALFNRAYTLDELGRYDDALADLNHALELQPDDADTLHNRGGVLDELGRYDDALADYNRALELQPEDASTIYARGITYDHLKRYDDALGDFNRALDVRPDHTDTLTSRGIVLQHLGRYHDALASYSRALELLPGDAGTFFNRACLYSCWNKLEDSLRDLRRAIELDSKYRELARTDADFVNLRNDPEYGPRFRELVGADEPPADAEDASPAS